MPTRTLAALAALLSLCACAGASSGNQTEALKLGLQHVELCDRTYTGGTGIGASFTFNIVCHARPAPETSAPQP